MQIVTNNKINLGPPRFPLKTLSDKSVNEMKAKLQQLEAVQQ